MKKWWIVAAIVVLIAIIGTILMWLKMNRHYDDNDPLKQIPSSAVAVLKVNGAKKYLLTIGSTEYQNDLKFASFDHVILNVIEQAYSTFSTAIKQEPNLGERTIYISVHANVKDSAEVVMMSIPLNNYADGSSIMDALRSSEVIATRDTVIAGETAICVANDKWDLFVVPVEGCMFASQDAGLIRDVIEGNKPTLNNDYCFSTLERTTSPSAPVSAFINIAALDSISWSNISGRMLSKYGTWTEMDFDIQQKSIATNGFLTYNKYSIISALAGHKPSAFLIDKVVPSCAEIFMSYAAAQRGIKDEAYAKYLDTENRLDDYKKRKQTLSDSTKTDVEEQLALAFCGDVALISLSPSLNDSANTCLIINAHNGTIAQAALNSVICAMEGVDTPQKVDVLSPVPSIGVPVYKALNDNAELFFLKDLLPIVPKKYYIRYENSLMLADNINVLKRALYETLLNRTLANDANFRNFRTNFSNDNVFFAFCTSTTMKNLITESKTLEENEAKSITNFYGFGLQISTLSGLPYITTCGLYDPSRMDLPPTAWQSKIDTTIVGKPYAVLNHNTGETEYFIQDANNKIYLINASGLVLWQRKVDGPILGSVKQIDYYTNKKLQYLFATPESVHLIDRNGNNTASFPIQLKNKATGGVTYIDYGNPKEFRLFVPCENNKIILYDKKCKVIDGWEMKRTEGVVKSDMEHWVSNNKDYLISKDDFRCYITDRRGNERVAIQQPIAPNLNSRVYLVRANTPDASFVTSTADGKMATIKIENAQITTTNIDSIGSLPHYMLKLNGEESFIFVNNKTIVKTDDRGHVTSIASINMSGIDWADVTVDNKIAIWDKKESLGYLIEPTGKIIDGFPIPAQSPLAISIADNVTNIVVAGDDGTLNNYIK